MTTAALNTPPSTLNGIRRHAKTYAKTHGIKHTAALDVIAQQAGFQNYKHALRKLSAENNSRFSVYLTAYWRNRRWSSELVNAGRETLRIELDRPLSQIIPSHKLKRAYELGLFKMESEDHLVLKDDADGVEHARTRLLDAARILTFIDVSALWPCTTEKQRGCYRAANSLPSKDHLKIWWHGELDQWVCLDEPYGNLAALRPIRDQWCKENDFFSVKANWLGLHSPGFAHPFLFTPSELVAQHLERALPKLRDHCLWREPMEWFGESGKYNELFHSPAAKLAGKPPKDRIFPMYAGTLYRGNIACNHQVVGTPTAWRPAVAMPLALHHECAEILHEISNALPYGSRRQQRVSKVMSKLDEWINAEHCAKVADLREIDCYLGGGGMHKLSEAELSDKVAVARAMLMRGYENCSSRNALIANLDKVIKTD